MALDRTNPTANPTYLIDPTFQRGLDRLPKHIRQKVTKTIEQVLTNPRHSGLKSHQIHSAPRRTIWESYVDDDHRLIWERVDGTVYLWRVGPHQVLDKAKSIGAADFGRAQRPAPTTDDDHADNSTTEGANWSTPGRVEFTAFRSFPTTVLQLLGVPEEHVRAVQRLTNAEEIWDLPLAYDVRSTLYDVLSNPELDVENVLFDPLRLLYRATADQLEGYCEGRIKRLLLNLEPDQEQFVAQRSSGPFLLRGVAGSGKTTIGIYRAKARAAERDLFRTNGRVLYLTYNATLAHAVAELFTELYGSLPDGIEVSTIDAWFRRFCERRGHQIKINRDRARALLHLAIKSIQTRRREPVLHRAPAFFDREIEKVIKGRDVRTLAEYLTLDRSGTGSGLGVAARHAVWSVYEEYEQRLQSEQFTDFAGVRLRALRELERLPDSSYDEVVIDEAQDLVPVQLRAVHHLARGESIFLLADAAQSIYYHGVSWRDAGIDIAGRTRILRTNHRNTVQVLRAAASLIACSPTLPESGESVSPEATHRNGPRPRVVVCPTTNEQARFVCNEILRLCVGADGSRYRPGDFAVLAPTSSWCNLVRDELMRKNIPWRMRDGGTALKLLENEVKLSTIHSAKGMEFPVVFVAGLVEGHPRAPSFPQAPDAAASPAEQIAALDNERRLLYVAMTRAADRLYLLTTRQHESRFLAEIDPETLATEAYPN